jgi:hypothetical protein
MATFNCRPTARRPIKAFETGIFPVGAVGDPRGNSILVLEFPPAFQQGLIFMGLNKVSVNAQRLFIPGKQAYSH